MAARGARAYLETFARVERANAEALMQEGDEDEEEEVSQEDPSQKALDASALYRAAGDGWDPRAPCAGDPPRCFLRVTLCCVALRTAAPCLVASRKADAPLDAVLDDLQRSFFAKPGAPLGPRDAGAESDRGRTLVVVPAERPRGGAAATVRSVWHPSPRKLSARHPRRRRDPSPRNCPRGRPRRRPGRAPDDAGATRSSTRSRPLKGTTRA